MTQLRQDENSESPQVFRLAKSSGAVWLIAFGLFCLAIAGYLLVVLASHGSLKSAVILIPVVVMMAIFAAVFFVVATWIPSMRYELGSGKLALRCGRLKYSVVLSDVKRVVKTNLALSLWSSMRLPGFALGSVPYAGTGNVIMCATRSLKDIILIETQDKKYGLTPKDEKAFLEALNQKLSSKH